MLIRQTLSIFYYQSGGFVTENLLQVNASTRTNLATIFIEGYFEAYFTLENYQAGNFLWEMATLQAER